MSEPQLYPVYFESEHLNEEKLKKIRNYFQIQRKSGGGDCSQITKFSDKVYKVDFKDRQAQQRVLVRREHKLEVGGSSLVLIVQESPLSTSAAPPTSSAAPRARHEQHPSSSASSLPSGGEEHEVKVDPYLLKYLIDYAQAQNELDRALRPLQSSARLYPEKETALVESLISFDDAEAAKTWKTEVENVFEEVKKRYVCHLECEGELRLLLLKSCNLCAEEEDVKVYSETELAIVVGAPSKVKARLEHVSKCHARIRGASLGQKQSRKRRIDKAKFHLLQNEIEQSLAKDVPNLQVTEAEEEQLLFEGTIEEIRKAYDIIKEKENMVKESTVSDISKHYLSFFFKEYKSGQRLSDFLGYGKSVTIEFTPTKIKILSLSAHTIEQTIKALKDKFKEEQMEVPNCFEVPVELQNSLKSRSKIMNEKGCKVHIVFTKNTVILIGHCKEVQNLHGVVTDYILDQSNIEDRVAVPFPELLQNLPKLLMLNGFDFDQVNFSPLESGVVALEGPSSAVSQVRSRLRPFLRSLVRESVTVDMPGALRYSKTQNGGEKLLDVASLHKCLIQLEDTTSASQREEVAARYFLKQGVQVIVYLGDITKQEADALVNAANEDLKHSGGVASALSKAAGPEVQRESSELVKSIGKLSTGEVVVTSGGKLKCKKLLHAVGPEKHKAGGRERELLEQTVESALVLAESMGFVSIALPCISSGIFGVPIDVCAEAIVSAVRAYGAVAGRSLTKITLIDNRSEVVQSLRAQCDRLLQGQAAGHTEGAGVLEPLTGAADGGSGGSVRVEIVQGTIESQQVDCLVCPMLGHQPTSTRLGQSLHSVAGPALLTKFNQSSGGATLPGASVLVEGIPGLLSKAVIFLNLMNYSSQQELAKQVLRQCIGSALVTCESRGFSSVVFPVTGPGGVLQFPHNTAALILLQEIQAFEQRRAARTPLQIRIVIHPNDKEASKAFQAAQQNVHLKGFTNDANPNHASFYRHVSSANNEVTALMGSVKLQVVQGDIIHEKTDVIVNSTGFKSEPAGVSKAILTAAGPNVQAELRRAGDPPDHMCCTAAGLLGCKEIVHVQTDREPQAINKTCKKVLKLCETKGYTSAAFPAINTGIGHMDYGTAGKAMLDGMASAITEISPKSLSLIRIVILQQPVFDAFKAELENRFGQVAPPQKWRGKLKNLLTKSKSPRSGANISPTKPQPAVFSVIGPSSDAIAALKKALEGHVQQQLGEREFELRDLCRLDEMEVEAVQAKARSYGVSLDHSVRRNTSTAQDESKNQASSGEKTVILRGLQEDVFIVAELVNKAIKKALCEDLQERQEQDLAQSVQWLYLNEGEDWEHFNLHQNYALEKAKEQKEVFVKTCEIKGNKVDVNLVALEATDCTTGKTYRVKRCETDTDIELPGYWKPMAGEEFKKVEVDPNSKEYQDIARGFHKTAKYKIHKLERVQNHHLWCSYFVMRRKMEMKNGAAELGEKYLYHGTSAESCHCIERDRFDRNYTGTHGAWYGTGVYFAILGDRSRVGNGGVNSGRHLDRPVLHCSIDITPVHRHPTLACHVAKEQEEEAAVATASKRTEKPAMAI